MTPSGVGIDNFAGILAREDYRATILRTFWFAAIVTVVSVPIGICCGLFLARTGLRRGPLLALVLTPWLVSVVVRSYGWTVVLGNRGVVNWALRAVGLTDAPVQFLYQPLGTIIGLVHVFAPLLVLSVMAAALHQDRALEEAASCLGSRPLQTFRLVTLPVLAPGIVTGSAIVFLLSCGAVVTPLLLGGLRQTMIASQIYQDIFHTFDLPKASAMSMILLAATLLIALVAKLVHITLAGTRRAG
ncbi:MAG: ABC transporter permease [Acetobacteraceae bacterium]|nr:ABC transporter permease [Acetobacteraceae bacterium]